MTVTTFSIIMLSIGVTATAVAVGLLSHRMLSMERRHSRRVDTLLDRLAHAQGRTWMPPPADTGDENEPAHAGFDPFQDPA